VDSRGSSDQVRTRQGIRSSNGGRRNLVRRLLHRGDPGGTARITSRSSSASSKRSMIDRLESFFAEDLPSSMEVLPKPAQEPSAPARVEKGEESGRAAEAKGNESRADSAKSAAFSAVRLIRISAKDAVERSQEAFRKIEASLKNHAREFEHRQAALSSASEAASTGLEELQRKLTRDLTERLEGAAQPLLARSAEQLEAQTAAAVSALQEKLEVDRQRFVADTEKQFETLRASRELFIDDTQKRLAETAQPSLDALTKAAVVRALADLDASRQTLIDETQAQLASSGRASLAPLTERLSKDAIEKVRAELAGSRQAFVEETQVQLAQLIQASQQVLRSFVATSVEQAHTDLMASHKQVLDDTRERVVTLARASLETEIKNAVEQGRARLREMVDAFLAKAVPQIETELERLVSRPREAMQAQREPPPITPVRNSSPAAAPARAPLALTTSQIVAAQAIEARPLAPVRAFPPPGRSLDFKLADSAPQRRIDRRDLWTGISSGLKLGVGLGAIALFVFLVYFFTSPVIRLRATPPAAFFDDSPGLTAKQRAQENNLARAYWNIAVTNIEGQYGFGSTLPANPPENFAVEGKGGLGGAPGVDQAARARYWEKLREIWPQADSWERTSSQGTDWIRSVWESASLKVNQLFNSGNASAAP
jgi:hypothetical protein